MCTRKRIKCGSSKPNEVTGHVNGSLLNRPNANTQSFERKTKLYSWGNVCSTAFM